MNAQILERLQADRIVRMTKPEERQIMENIVDYVGHLDIDVR